MKKFTFLLLICTIFIFLCSCGVNSEAIDPEINNIHNLQIESFEDIGENLHLKALKLTECKSNNLGFSLIGSQGNADKIEYIYNYFQKIGLSNVSKIPIISDGWELTDIQMVYPCTCVDEGYYTISKIAVYPSNFSFNDINCDFVNVEDGEIDKYTDIDVFNKGVLINTDFNIFEKVELAKQKGAEFVIYKVNNPLDSTYNYIDLNIKMPDDIIVFSISASTYDSLIRETDYSEILPITIRGSSELYHDIESNFVVGEIEGKNKDKFVYITTNMDTFFQGFHSSCLSIAEIFVLAETLIENNFVPEYTIKFLITNGSEWSSMNDEVLNAALRSYLDNINKDSIESVLVIDGSKYLSTTVFTETQVTSNLKSKILDYNNSFDFSSYNIINTVKEMDDYRYTDALIWCEYVDNVILQAEYNSSRFKYYENGSNDSPSLGTDATVAKFVLSYYLGLIDILC